MILFLFFEDSVKFRLHKPSLPNALFELLRRLLGFVKGMGVTFISYGVPFFYHFLVDVDAVVIANADGAVIFVGGNPVTLHSGGNHFFQSLPRQLAARVGVVFGIITFLKIFRRVNSFEPDFRLADKNTVAVHNFDVFSFGGNDFFGAFGFGLKKHRCAGFGTGGKISQKHQKAKAVFYKLFHKPQNSA